MVVFLIAIVVVAVIAYLAVLYFQRSYGEAIEEQQKKIQEIANKPLTDALTKISRLNLSGESLTEFETLDKGYHYLKNRELPELTEILADLSDETDHLQFFRVSRGLKIIRRKSTGAQEHFSEIKRKLDSIQSSTKQHEDTLKKLQERYQELRKTLLAKNFSFGPSIDKLEQKSADVEDDFGKYTKLSKSGDYVSSEGPLNKLRGDMAILEDAVGKIPAIFKNLNNIFPVQLSELKTGLQKMKDEHYSFREDLNGKLQKITEKCAENNENLANLDLTAAQELDKELVKEIDYIYSQIELEYSAGTQLPEKLKHLGKFLVHAQKRQKELEIELDRLGQNYTFNNQEDERSEDLKNTLGVIQKHYDQINHAVEQGKERVSSQAIDQFEQDEKKLHDVEEEQKKINESISALWKEEKDALEAVENFDIEIHRMKREIEKLNLPGLPQDYLDYFFKVSDEIEALDANLNKMKIDMSAVTKALINTQSDLDVLNNKNDEIKDSSKLAERLLQYSNRYRNRYPEVEQAYQQSIVQFEKDFNYVGALDTISQALDTVEPGSFKRISEQFQAEKDSVAV